MTDFTSFVNAARNFGTSNAPLELTDNEAPPPQPLGSRSSSISSLSSIESAGQPLLDARFSQTGGRLGKFIATLRDLFGIYSTPQRLATQRFIESVHAQGGEENLGLVNQILRREGIREGRGLTPQQVLRVNASLTSQEFLNQFLDQDVDLRSINNPGTIMHDIGQEILQEIKDANDAILQDPTISPADKRRQIHIIPEQNEINFGDPADGDDPFSLEEILFLIESSKKAEDGSPLHFDHLFNDAFYQNIASYVEQYEQRRVDLSESQISVHNQLKEDIKLIIKATLKPLIENAIYKVSSNYDLSSSPNRGLERGFLFGDERTKSILQEANLSEADIHSSGLASDFNGLLRSECTYRNLISRLPSAEQYAIRNPDGMKQIVSKLISGIKNDRSITYSQPLEKLANWNRELLNARAELKNQIRAATSPEQVAQVRANFEAKKAEFNLRLAEKQREIPGNLPELRLHFEFERVIDEAINHRLIEVSPSDIPRPAVRVQVQQTAVASAFVSGTARAHAHVAEPITRDPQLEIELLVFNGDFESAAFQNATETQKQDAKSQFLDIQNAALEKAYRDADIPSPLVNAANRNQALVDQIHGRLSQNSLETFRREFAAQSAEIVSRIGASGPSTTQKSDLQDIAVDLLARQYAAVLAQ